jgi:hypothetical protein
MNMLEFATGIVQAAKAGVVTILPMSQRDRAQGCLLRFRLGSI